jgi:hypothetical protein
MDEDYIMEQASMTVSPDDDSDLAPAMEYDPDDDNY